MPPPMATTLRARWEGALSGGADWSALRASGVSTAIRGAFRLVRPGGVWAWMRGFPGVRDKDNAGGGVGAMTRGWKGVLFVPTHASRCDAREWGGMVGAKGLHSHLSFARWGTRTLGDGPMR